MYRVEIQQAGKKPAQELWDEVSPQEIAFLKRSLPVGVHLLEDDKILHAGTAQPQANFTPALRWRSWVIPLPDTHGALRMGGDWGFNEAAGPMADRTAPTTPEDLAAVRQIHEGLLRDFQTHYEKKHRALEKDFEERSQRMRQRFEDDVKEYERRRERMRHEHEDLVARRAAELAAKQRELKEVTDELADKSETLRAAETLLRKLEASCDQRVNELQGLSGFGRSCANMIFGLVEQYKDTYGPPGAPGAPPGGRGGGGRDE